MTSPYQRYATKCHHSFMFFITTATFRPLSGFIGSFDVHLFKKIFLPLVGGEGVDLGSFPENCDIQIQQLQYSDSELLYRDRHSGLDPESSLFIWIPASPGMTFIIHPVPIIPRGRGSRGFRQKTAQSDHHIREAFTGSSLILRSPPLFCGSSER